MISEGEKMKQIIAEAKAKEGAIKEAEAKKEPKKISEYTKEELAKMSRDDINKNWDQVKEAMMKVEG